MGGGGEDWPSKVKTSNNDLRLYNDVHETNLVS